MADDVCENVIDEDGNPINGGDDSDLPTGGNSCAGPAPDVENAVGAALCPDTGSSDKTCKPWQLSKGRDNCFIDGVVNESLNIGAADINVFKLLGIHEQGQLVDVTGNGSAISGGDVAGFGKEKAFTIIAEEWHSAQTGSAVTTSAYIGYDFGEIKLDNDRRRYGTDTSIKHNIATIKLKQGNNAVNRATKIRVERSEDGKTWFGVAILTMPDDDCYTTAHFKNTAPMRYWRLRPVEFNGSVGNHWAVQALEMMDYDRTSIEDIQDKIWNENRDRDYATETLLLKGTYPLTDEATDMSRAGIELPNQIIPFVFGFSSVIAILGRPLVVGDIFEVPSEIQFNAKMEPVKKYMEVIDVTWDAEGYTPGWVTTLMRATAQPMMATQETADIFGGLESYDDGTGRLVNKDGTEDMESGNHSIFQDYSDISHTIEQTATDKAHVPQRGRDPADVHQFTPEEREALINQDAGNTLRLGLRPRDLYVEDAMPPNGEAFTEGETLPPVTGLTDGAWHRQTYENIDETIPARLFKYSEVKNRWIFMESDKRMKYEKTRPILQEFLSSPDKKPAKDIGK